MGAVGTTKYGWLRSSLQQSRTLATLKIDRPCRSEVRPLMVSSFRTIEYRRGFVALNEGCALLALVVAGWHGDGLGSWPNVQDEPRR